MLPYLITELWNEGGRSNKIGDCVFSWLGLDGDLKYRHSKASWMQTRGRSATAWYLPA